MPVICAAVGCNNKFVKGAETRFYRFPLSKPDLVNKWVQSLGMKDFTPTANTCLCSEHFKSDCFRDYNGKQFLREDAIPSIFNQGQDSSKIELRKRGVTLKESSVTNQVQTPAERERARDTAQRRDNKRGGMRGGRGSRGGKQQADRSPSGAGTGGHVHTNPSADNNVPRKRLRRRRQMERIANFRFVPATNAAATRHEN
ncbi:ARL14 effector protein isoform X2 [Gouania willdenowi]|uniref:ARL14 effector protein isoform X2 n=1 Tax=Gouania willdenowi TaxID=441366 RepID=UPI0010569B3E|nr:ARL14 effector protein isoform X2 [Gouania willdenowi]